MLSIRQKDANLLNDIRLQGAGGWFRTMIFFFLLFRGNGTVFRSHEITKYYFVFTNSISLLRNTISRPRNTIHFLVLS